MTVKYTHLHHPSYSESLTGMGINSSALLTVNRFPCKARHLSQESSPAVDSPPLNTHCLIALKLSAH